MADAAPAISKQLIARLPRTFAPAINEQLRNWDLLFAAERRSLMSQLAYLNGLPPPAFERLMQRVFEIERKMDLPAWNAESSGMSVHEVGMLARSPHYPEWRTAVEQVFAEIDTAVQRQSAGTMARSLAICLLPAGLPVEGRELWPELAKRGRWIRLDTPFGETAPKLAASIASRKLNGEVEPSESTWVLECETELTDLLGDTPATCLSWAQLEPVRREFLGRLNRIGRSLKAVDEATAELKHASLDKILPRRLNADPRLREFVRGLLLSGNGSLVFDNSFVQWGSAEALRRAQPQALIAYFGIRPKLKPFSSAVLFEDQKRSNPTPDAPDPEGSLTDALILAEYVHYAAERNRPTDRIATVMSCASLDRCLLLGDVPRVSESMSYDRLQSALMDWLA